MGIQGLWPLLKDHTKSRHIKEYAGQRVAVDGYVWLHKAAFGCCVDLALGKDTKQWVGYCLDYIDLLLQAGIEVHLVFDGGPLPAKRLEEEGRRARRAAARREGMALLRSGRSADARVQLSRAVDISPLMAAKLIQVCRESRPQVKCLVAPYEADAQLAFLCRAGIVDAVVTEDSDTVPYGCKEIITKLEKNGSCQCLSLSDIYANPSETDFRPFDPTMMAVMCVAAGCDYASSLSGIGVKKSYKYVLRHRTAHRLLRALRFEGAVPLREALWPLAPPPAEKLYQYELDFYMALMTFHHQTVFDPVSRKVRPLMDIPPLADQGGAGGGGEADLHRMYATFLPSGGKDHAFSSQLAFLGPHIDSDIACDIADGLRDPETLALFDLDAPLASPTSVTEGPDPSRAEKSALNNFFAKAKSQAALASATELYLTSDQPHLDVASRKAAPKRRLQQFMASSAEPPAAEPAPAPCAEDSKTTSAQASTFSNYFSCSSGAAHAPPCSDGRAPSESAAVSSFSKFVLCDQTNTSAVWTYDCSASDTRTHLAVPSSSPAGVLTPPGAKLAAAALTTNVSERITGGSFDFSLFAMERTPEPFAYTVSSSTQNGSRAACSGGRLSASPAEVSDPADLISGFCSTEELSFQRYELDSPAGTGAPQQPTGGVSVSTAHGPKRRRRSSRR